MEIDAKAISRFHGELLAGLRYRYVDDGFELPCVRIYTNDVGNGASDLPPAFVPVAMLTPQLFGLQAAGAPNRTDC